MFQKRQDFPNLSSSFCFSPGNRLRIRRIFSVDPRHIDDHFSRRIGLKAQDHIPVKGDFAVCPCLIHFFTVPRERYAQGSLFSAFFRVEEMLRLFRENLPDRLGIDIVDLEIHGHRLVSAVFASAFIERHTGHREQIAVTGRVDKHFRREIELLPAGKTADAAELSVLNAGRDHRSMVQDLHTRSQHHQFHLPL